MKKTFSTISMIICMIFFAVSFSKAQTYVMQNNGVRYTITVSGEPGNRTVYFGNYKATIVKEDHYLFVTGTHGKRWALRWDKNELKSYSVNSQGQIYGHPYVYFIEANKNKSRNIDDY